jgi:isopenicillin-N N-acyltransferase-like protein
MTTSRYREIDVAGSCRMMGREIGEAAREEIRGFVATAFERMQQSIGMSHQRLYEIVASSMAFTEDYSPDLLEELHGMSEGSGVALNDLMFLQIRNQLTTEQDSGCTSFSAAASSRVLPFSIVGQNWDNDPALDPYTIVLTRRPTNRPAFISVTQAGLIAYIGFNDAGIAACLNSLPAPSRPTGVPHYFTLRRIFECRTLDDAVHAVQSARRAIPANIMLATPQGPADLEVTVDSVHVLRNDHHAILTHTNHCLHPQLLSVNDQFGELIQSKPRLRRIDELLNGTQAVPGIGQFQSALRDHQDFPKSICRHANEDPQHGFWQTVFSVIMVPEAGEMHIARGTPCDHDYEVYRLAE